MKLGLQLYSVRKETEADFYATLKSVKEMGYEGVEFGGLYGVSPVEMKQMLDEIGLFPISAHIDLDEMRANARDAFADYHCTIGCPYIAVPYLIPEDRPVGGDFGRTIKDIDAISKVAHETGVKLIYHNHGFEFEQFGGGYALDVLLETIPAEYLQTELDTCWVKASGVDPAAYILKYAGRAPVVHLKDYWGVAGEKSFQYRPVGFGVQEWPSILDACEQAGTEWVIVEQDRASLGKTPMESAKMSREYLKILGI